MKTEQGLELKSRAVIRDIEPGGYAECSHCNQSIKFQAKCRELKQVICNVYRKGTWIRVDHYHGECYSLAGDPHGKAEATQSLRAKFTRAANSRAKQITRDEQLAKELTAV